MIRWRSLIGGKCCLDYKSTMKINEDVEHYFKYDMLKLLRIVLAA
jgi:hypothetical protein